MSVLESPQRDQSEWNAIVANLIEIMRNIERGNDACAEGEVISWYSRARIIESMLRTRCVDKIGVELYNSYNFMERFSEISLLLAPRPGLTQELAARQQGLAEGSARMKMYAVWADLLKVGYDSEVLWPKKKVVDPVAEVGADY